MPYLYISPFMAVKIAYLWRKTETGPFWFKRRVPLDLVKAVGRDYVQVSLGTRDFKVAARKIETLAKKLDAEWAHMRSPSRASSIEQGHQLLASFGVDPSNPKADPESLEVFFDMVEDQLPPSVRHAHYQAYQEGDTVSPEDIDRHLPASSAMALALAQERIKILASDCRDQYIKARASKPRTVNAASIPFKYLIELLGDRDIRRYRRADANRFVQHLLSGDHSENGKPIATTTVQRYLTTLRAAWAYVIKENELDCKNPWSSIEIPGLGRDEEKRVPFTVSDYRLLYAATDSHGLDGLRCILTLVAETGARLAEIVGLGVEDCHIDVPVPFIHIRPHPWRSLKTAQSARKVPLTLRALVAVKAARELKGHSAYLFPRYTSSAGCKADTVSATLNKWIRTNLVEVGRGLTMHSLRHGMTDLLREVGCHTAVINQLLGWESAGQGEKYGAGYSLAQLKDWLDRATALHAG
ncbi:DUF6538 domain-containing protein [Cupriavidus pampae]|uniref:Tyrosine recombinase XerC n=1 Tax=Cupriavidus pampae TaxID=659251 RepID=A0ABN7Y8U1_9BURK|nr:DUF6538 domain-containing protein [Cupriavidus pampae]CAG9168959.1 Tyrosine recombinase XerC [Cupriavidus pampae]